MKIIRFPHIIISCRLHSLIRPQQTREVLLRNNFYFSHLELRKLKRLAFLCPLFAVSAFSTTERAVVF